MASEFTRPDGLHFSLMSAEVSQTSCVYKTAPESFYDEFGEPLEGFYDEIAWLYDSKFEYTNFGWYGYRKGQIVGIWEGFRDSPFLTTETFGKNFANLDKLVIRIFAPEEPLYRTDTGVPPVIAPNTVWIDQWSGDQLVLSITFDVGPSLAPVPLPATLPLFAMGLGLLAALRHRRA